MAFDFNKFGTPTTTAPPQSPQSQGGGFKFETFGGAPTAPQKKKGALRKVAEFVAPATTRIVEKAFDPTQDVTARDVLGTALEVGSFVIPTGAAIKGATLAARGLGLAGKTATRELAKKGFARTVGEFALGGGVSGGLAGAGRTVSEGADIGAIARETAAGATGGALVGAALPVAGKAIGGAVGLVKGQLAQRAAKKATQEALLKTAAPDARIATKALEKGEVVTDPLAKAVVKTNIPEADVALIKSSTPKDQQKMLRMLDIRVAQTTNKRLLDRASDVAGDTALERAKFVQKTNKEASKLLESAAEGLKGQRVDPTEAIRVFADDLDKAGVKVGPKGKLNFVGSDFEGIRAIQLPIQQVWNRALRIAKSGDALDLHRAKRYIDNVVEYGAEGEGLRGNAERMLKGFRRAADGILDTQFASYNNANTIFSETIRALDNLGRAVGKRFKIGDPHADKQMGITLRRLFSNVQSRSQLLQSLDEMQKVAAKYGMKIDEDVINQAAFVDTLENMFGSEAPTSFTGGIERGVRGVQEATQIAAEAVRGRPIRAALRAGGHIWEVMRGQTRERQVEALRNLLGRGSVTTQPLKGSVIGRGAIIRSPSPEISKKSVLGSVREGKTLVPNVTYAEGIARGEKSTIGKPRPPKGPGVAATPETAAFEAKKSTRIDTTTKEMPKGAVLFHGTSAKEFKSFKGDAIYLTTNRKEAGAFAKGVHLGGGMGGPTRTMSVEMPSGKVKNIDDVIEKVIMEGDDIDSAIRQEIATAKQKGFEFLSFKHPPSIGDEDFDVFVALNPEGLKITTQKSNLGKKITSLGRMPSETSKDWVSRIVREHDVANVPDVSKDSIVKMQAFGSAVEGGAKPEDIDIFVTVKDGSMKFPKRGGLPAPIIKQKGKVQYFIMPESDADDLLRSMLYEGRKDPSRAFSGRVVNIPKESFGAFAGVETDEKGELSFSPEKAALGVAGVAAFTQGKGLRNFTEKVSDNISKILKSFEGSPKGRAFTDRALGQLSRQFKSVQLAGQRLRDTGLKSNRQIADEMEQSLFKEINKAREGVRMKVVSPEFSQKPNQGGIKVTDEITLYHGTKQPFGKFSREKFGGGSGGDLWGEGVYLTDSKEVARGYANEGSTKGFILHTKVSPKIDGRFFEPYEKSSWREFWEQFSADLSALSGGEKDFIKRLNNRVGKNAGFEEMAKDYWVNSKGMKYVTKDDRIGAQKKFLSFIKARINDTITDHGDATPGERLKFTDSDFSQYINSLGFRGIKYDAGKVSNVPVFGKSSNYVIFDPDKVIINDSEAGRVSLKTLLIGTGVGTGLALGGPAIERLISGDPQADFARGIIERADQGDFEGADDALKLIQDENVKNQLRHYIFRKSQQKANNP